jgi:hypothetical protein
MAEFLFGAIAGSIATWLVMKSSSIVESDAQSKTLVAALRSVLPPEEMWKEAGHNSVLIEIAKDDLRKARDVLRDAARLNP